jgi:hypothetical protein
MGRGEMNWVALAEQRRIYQNPNKRRWSLQCRIANFNDLNQSDFDSIIWIALYCIALSSIVLHYLGLDCIASNCIVLHCSGMLCFALHCTTLHCTEVDRTQQNTAADSRLEESRRD